MPQRPNMIPIDHDKPREKFLGLTLPKTPKELTSEYLESQDKPKEQLFPETPANVFQEKGYSKNEIAERAMPSYLHRQLINLGGYLPDAKTRDNAARTIRMQQEKDSENMGGSHWSKEDIAKLEKARNADLRQLDKIYDLIGDDDDRQNIFGRALKSQTSRVNQKSHDSHREGNGPQWEPSTGPKTIFGNNSGPILESMGNSSIRPAPFANAAKKPSFVERALTYFLGKPGQGNNNSLPPTPAPSPSPSPEPSSDNLVGDIPTVPPIGKEAISSQTALDPLGGRSPATGLKGGPGPLGIGIGVAMAGYGIASRVFNAIKSPPGPPQPYIPPKPTRKNPYVPKEPTEPQPYKPQTPTEPNPYIPPEPVNPEKKPKPEPQEDEQDRIKREKKEKKEKEKKEKEDKEKEPERRKDPAPPEEDKTSKEETENKKSEGPEKEPEEKKDPKPEDQKKLDPAPPEPAKPEPPKKTEEKEKPPIPWNLPALMLPQGGVQSFPSLITGIPTHSAPSFEKTHLEINYYSELGF